VSCGATVLEGCLRSGLGEGAGFTALDWVDRQFRAKLGFSPYPGTLNLSLKGGVNVVIEAGVQLTLKAGGSSVVLGPDGVSITGVMVKVNSGGAAGSGSAANAKKPTKPDKAQKPPKLEDPLAGKHR
jgi:hypothetical protein